MDQEHERPEPRKDVPRDHPVTRSPEERERERREDDLARALGEAEARKVRARRRREESVWFGLGTFGLVGWAVALPTLIALALGIWLDANYPQRFSWTLTLLFAGIVAGCFNAWYWVSRERDQIGHDQEDDDGV
ncbi:MAG: hypothetical protein GX131_12655 [candidate division WS1 bacterium]|jgi:ATP synthase protein I|nr:hypothetical protein [candidate division WS1 bacterium]